MINGSLNTFLDTGWYSEATIFYNGYIYWLESDTNEETGITHFFIDRWQASTDDNITYKEHLDRNGNIIGFSRVLDIYDENMDIIKRKFLLSEIFEGHSFWDVEKQLAWLDQGDPILV